MESVSMPQVQKKAYLINAWNNGEADYMIIESEASEDALEAAIDARLKQEKLCGVDCVDTEELSTASDLSVLSDADVQIAKIYFTKRLAALFWHFDDDQRVAKFLPEPLILDFDRAFAQFSLSSRGVTLISVSKNGENAVMLQEEECFKAKSLKLLQILSRVAEKIDEDLMNEAHPALEEAESAAPSAEADVDQINVALI